MNAIVTGATRGMGRAIARHLAASNYNLALCARNAADLESLRNELLAEFPDIRVLVQVADCGNARQVHEFAQFVEANFEFTDVLVNNAGLFIPSALLDEQEDALQLQMQTNVFTPHFLSKFFGKKMRQHGKGHIFNICSVASLQPALNAGSYSISKTALLGLTKVLREELMAYNVKVTAVLPGSTLTGSWAGTTIPESRFVRADDIASAVINCLKMSVGANVDEIVIRPVQGQV